MAALYHRIISIGIPKHLQAHHGLLELLRLHHLHHLGVVHHLLLHLPHLVVCAGLQLAHRRYCARGSVLRCVTSRLQAARKNPQIVPWHVPFDTGALTVTGQQTGC